MAEAEALVAGYPVVVRWPVAWGDMDFYRHVNNTVYFRYFENARLEYFRRMDWFEYEKRTGVGPILAETMARFIKAITYPDTVVVGVRVASVAEDRFTLDYLAASQAQGVITTYGQGVIVTFNHERGMKVAIPDELRRRIADIEARRL